MKPCLYWHAGQPPVKTAYTLEGTAWVLNADNDAAVLARCPRQAGLQELLGLWETCARTEGGPGALGSLLLQSDLRTKYAAYLKNGRLFMGWGTLAKNQPIIIDKGSGPYELAELCQRLSDAMSLPKRHRQWRSPSNVMTPTISWHSGSIGGSGPRTGETRFHLEGGKWIREAGIPFRPLDLIDVLSEWADDCGHRPPGTSRFRVMELATEEGGYNVHDQGDGYYVHLKRPDTSFPHSVDKVHGPLTEEELLACLHNVMGLPKAAPRVEVEF